MKPNKMLKYDENHNFSYYLLVFSLLAFQKKEALLLGASFVFPPKLKLFYFNNSAIAEVSYKSHSLTILPSLLKAST